RRGPVVAAVVAVGLLGAATGAAVWFNPFGARPPASTAAEPRAAVDTERQEKSSVPDLQPGPADHGKSGSAGEPLAPAPVPAPAAPRPARPLAPRVPWPPGPPAQAPPRRGGRH